MGSLIPWRRTRSREEPELTPGLTEYIKEVVKAELAKRPTRIDSLDVTHNVGVGGDLTVDGDAQVYGYINADEHLSANDLYALGTYTLGDSNVYIGGAAATGRWRITIDDTDLLFQRIESGTYVTKHTIED